MQEMLRCFKRNIGIGKLLDILRAEKLYTGEPNEMVQFKPSGDSFFSQKKKNAINPLPLAAFEEEKK